MALAWVPFSLAVLAVRGNQNHLNQLVAATLLFSVAHQPLTLGLVYGDPRQFAVKPKVFMFAPFVLAAAIWAGVHVSLVAVGVIGGLWNAEHTLMQRFGLTRIYGRKGGDDHGTLEKRMLISWLVLVLVWAAADTRTVGALAQIELGARNESGIEVLTSLRPLARLLLAPVFVGVGVLTARWVRAERALGAAMNRAKHFYVGTTALLFVVMLIDPVVGFVGYVGAHAAEYFVIIHQALKTRYVDPVDPSPVGRSVRTPFGRFGAIAGFLIAVFTVLALIKGSWSPAVYTIVLLTMGAMHIFFDGFIWKLRRPEVAKAFEIS